MFRACAALIVLCLSACGGETTPVPTPPVIVQLIEFWQPAGGLLEAGETDGWLFVGKAGDAIRVGALIQSGAPFLNLLSTDGATLAQGETVEATLPADGTYTILIYSEAGGQYELGLGYADRPNPADYTPTPLPVTVAVPTPTPPYYTLIGTQLDTIRSGQRLAGSLDSADARHVYTFDGVNGQFANITVRSIAGALDPIVTLYGPDGAEVATDDNSGGEGAALLRNILLLNDGTYSIVVSGHEFTGGYEVILFTSGAISPVTPTYVIQPTATRETEILTPTLAAAASSNLEDHVPVIATIENPGEVNRFIVFATVGDIITIGASPVGRSNLLPELEVYDPDGALVASATVRNSEAGGDALVSALQAASTGGYQVFVTGDNDTVGSYVMSYGMGVSREEVLRGEILVDQATNGQLARRGLRDTWSIYLNTGDVITAAVSPTDEFFDPVVELVAPDGSVVAQDDNSGGGRAALIGGALAPVSGLYHVRVTAAGGFGSGTYALIWHYVNLAPTATPLPGSVVVLSFADDIPPSTYQFYTFQGRAGQQVRIQVVAEDGSNFDPVAALLGLDGAVIAEGDDSDGGLNPCFTAELPSDGTYSVRVNGYLTGGRFALLVEALYPRTP